MYKNNPETYQRRDILTSLSEGSRNNEKASRREDEFFRCLREAPVGGYVCWNIPTNDQPSSNLD